MSEGRHIGSIKTFMTFKVWKESHQGLIDVSEISSFKELSMEFTCSSKVTMSKKDLSFQLYSYHHAYDCSSYVLDAL